MKAHLQKPTASFSQGATSGPLTFAALPFFTVNLPNDFPSSGTCYEEAALSTSCVANSTKTKKLEWKSNEILAPQCRVWNIERERKRGEGNGREPGRQLVREEKRVHGVVLTRFVCLPASVCPDLKSLLILPSFRLRFSIAVPKMTSPYLCLTCFVCSCLNFKKTLKLNALKTP